MSGLLQRTLVVLMAATAALAEEAKAAPGQDLPAVYRSVGLGWAAALAIALSIFGAAHAVAKIGSAAMGTAAEKPDLLNRSLVFVALAEGLAVLGFAISMMIVQKI